MYMSLILSILGFAARLGGSYEIAELDPINISLLSRIFFIRLRNYFDY